MTTLSIADLHEDYHTAAYEDCVAMANVGAHCWRAFKDGLFDKWTRQLTGTEAEKAAIYRAEGRYALLESVKSTLSAGEGAVAEGRIQQLQANMDAEIARRVAKTLDGHRKDIEIAKMGEITALKERIAAAEGREALIPVLNRIVTLMESKIEYLKQRLEEESRVAMCE